MSSLLQERFRPQRRLGLLRNTYPSDVVLTQQPTHDVRQCCSAFARSMRSQGEANESPQHIFPFDRRRTTRPRHSKSDERAVLLCREKLSKLRAIRNDNALLLLHQNPGKATLSPIPHMNFDVNKVSNCISQLQPHHQVHKLPSKPSTAPGSLLPASGNLNYRIFDENSTATPCGGTSRNNRALDRDFCFVTDELGNSELMTSQLSHVTGGCYRYIHTAPGGQARRISRETRRNPRCEKVTYDRSRLPRTRAYSAPFPSPQNTPRVQSGVSPSVASQYDMKIPPPLPPESPKPQNEASQQKVNKPRPSYRRLSRAPSSVAMAVSSALARGRECILPEERNLGIVGEHFAPCRPKTPLKVNRVVRLNNAKPVVAREVCVVPGNGRQESADDRIPAAPETSGCQCKSVRFSCTENTVHQYRSSDPITP